MAYDTKVSYYTVPVINEYIVHKYFHHSGQLAYNTKVSYYTVPGQSFLKWLISK